MHVLKPSFSILAVNLIAVGLWGFVPWLYVSEGMYGAHKFVSAFSIITYCIFFCVLCVTSSIMALSPSTARSNYKYYRCRYNVRIVLLLHQLGTVLGWIAFISVAVYLLRIYNYVGSSMYLFFAEGNLLALKYLIDGSNLTAPYASQLSMVSATLLALYYFYYGMPAKLSHAITWSAILAPQLVRAVLLSERLAVFEVLVPVVIVYVHSLFYRYNYREYVHKLRATLLIAAVFIVFLFVVAESYRSYNLWAETAVTSKLVWGASTLVSYPVSTVNYSMALIGSYSDGYTFPVNALSFLGENLVSWFPEQSRAKAQGHYELRHSPYGSSGYTNIGFAGQWYLEVGPFFIVFGAIIGLAIGLIYRMFQKGHIIGLLLYPLVFVGILESYRLDYFTEIRFVFPVLICLFILTPLVEVLNYKARKSEDCYYQTRREELGVGY